MNRSESIIKIVVVGPESTGKSTLCAALADHFHTLWCREYAREFLLQHGMEYSYEDLLTIAKGQLALEDEATERCRKEYPHASQPPLLFLDTDMYVMKIWSEFVFGKCHPMILNEIVNRTYDGYLLCKTDLPWGKDELREYPDTITRDTLYHLYKDALINQYTPWLEVSGEGDARTQQAIDWVTTIVSKQ